MKEYMIIHFVYKDLVVIRAIAFDGENAAVGTWPEKGTMDILRCTSVRSDSAWNAIAKYRKQVGL